jgi:sugar lactone lactonase YvrE
MANGLALAPDGTLYASDDVGVGIDRVVHGQVENHWASVISSNGLVVDRAGENLYANQTFQPAAIVKIPLDDPTAASTYVEAPPGDTAAGPDGLTRDGLDRLYVAANGGGQIWRVNRRRQICSLAETAPLGPSAVSFGHGRDGPFPHTNLYFVTFGGELVELHGVLRGRRPRR